MVFVVRQAEEGVLLIRDKSNDARFHTPEMLEINRTRRALEEEAELARNKAAEEHKRVTEATQRRLEEEEAAAAADAARRREAQQQAAAVRRQTETAAIAPAPAPVVETVSSRAAPAGYSCFVPVAVSATMALPLTVWRMSGGSTVS